MTKHYTTLHCTAPHVQCRYYCRISMKGEFSRDFRKKKSNIKFHENPSSGSRVVAYGRTDGQTQRSLQSNVTFSGPRIVIYSYNESQLDALFLKVLNMFRTGPQFCESG